MSLPQQKAHRSSSLKQQNKKHNQLGHKSKREVANLNKGKVNDLKILVKTKAELNKKEKKNKHDQKRKHKQDEAVKMKHNLGTNETAPFLVLIVPMTEYVLSHNIIKTLCLGDPDAIADIDLGGITHLACKRFNRRLSFVAPSVLDRTSIIDVAKVSDSVLFVWDANEEDITEEGKMLLTIVKSQALPTVVHAICGLDSLSQKKKIRVLKELKKDISIIFPEQSKVFSLDNTQETLLLLRQLVEQKKHNIYFRDKRSHMLAEDVDFIEVENGLGTLVVTGYVRGQCLSADNIVHIPGWEDYQIDYIQGMRDPHLIGKVNFLRCKFPDGCMDYPNAQFQRSVQSTKEVNLDEEYEDMIEPEELLSDAGDCSEDSADEFGDENNSYMECAPTEKYAGFEDDSGAESLDELEDDVEENPEPSSDTEDIAYDEEVDYAAERVALEQQMEQDVEDNKLYPDEIETPFEQKALVRFNKYRGLESFRTSPWEQTQPLPVDFRRITRIRGYAQLRKSILKFKEQGVPMGAYVRVHLKNVSKRVYDEHKKEKTPLVLVSLLLSEQEIGMVNVVIKSHSSGHSEAIKSKDRLVFHVGFRRYSNCPIFSEHSSANKFLFLRYFHPLTTVVASMFAPITFGPCPVSVFKDRMDGTGIQDLVATGSLHSVNDNRIMCKRICLSGHPFKIKPHVTVVRYMFFDREDIEFFRKIGLRTKRGARGKILGPIGTHGHMKCNFKEKLNSQDVVFLQLYKRVFPKWKYEPLVDRLKITTWNDVTPLVDDEPKAKKGKTVKFSIDV